MKQKTEQKRGMFWARTVASAVVIMFTATSVAMPSPVHAAPSASGGVVTVGVPTLIEIPQAIGNIQTQRIDPNAERVIVLVQDAHAVIDAQENIRDLIGHFQQAYGTELFFVEGAKGQLDPTLLRAYPSLKRKKQVLASYLDLAELSGTETASVLNEHLGSFHGLEDWTLYSENYLAFQNAQRNKRALQRQLKNFKSGLNSEKEKIFTPELMEFQDTWEDFRAERLSLLDLVLYLANFESLMKGRPEFAELAKLTDSIGYEKSGRQEALDPIVKQMALEYKKNFARDMDVKEQTNFHLTFQRFMTGQISAGQMLKYLVQAGAERGFQPRLTPQMRRLLGHAEILTELRGSRIYNELQKFLPEAEASLVRSPEERELVADYQKLFLLEDLVKLELTHEVFDKFQKDPDAYLGLLEDEEFREGVRPALEFYDYALRRDRVFYGRLQKAPADAKTIVLIAGGFHTNGLRRILEEKGESYAVVTPRIDSLTGQGNYFKVMAGDLSYKDYLRTTYYDALMRDAMRKLTEPLKELDFRRTLKLWRDNLIRTLAGERRVTDLDRYTRYLDELNLVYQERFGKLREPRSNEELLNFIKKELENFRDNALAGIWERFAEQLKVFTGGLQGLVDKKQLDRDHVTGLLTQMGGSKPSMLAMIQALDPEATIPGLTARPQLQEALRGVLAPTRQIREALGPAMTSPTSAPIQSAATGLAERGAAFDVLAPEVGRVDPAALQASIDEIARQAAPDKALPVAKAEIAAVMDRIIAKPEILSPETRREDSTEVGIITRSEVRDGKVESVSAAGLSGDALDAVLDEIMEVRRNVYVPRLNLAANDLRAAWTPDKVEGSEEFDQSGIAREEAKTRGLFRSIIESNGTKGGIFVVRRNGKVIGYSVSEIDTKDPSVGTISELAVDAQGQGAFIGTRLAGAAVDSLESMPGIQMLTLTDGSGGFTGRVATSFFGFTSLGNEKYEKNLSETARSEVREGAAEQMELFEWAPVSSVATLSDTMNAAMDLGEAVRSLTVENVTAQAGKISELLEMEEDRVLPSIAAHLTDNGVSLQLPYEVLVDRLVEGQEDLEFARMTLGLSFLNKIDALAWDANTGKLISAADYFISLMLRSLANERVFPGAAPYRAGSHIMLLDVKTGNIARDLPRVWSENLDELQRAILANASTSSQQRTTAMAQIDNLRDAYRVGHVTLNFSKAGLSLKQFEEDYGQAFDLVQATGAGTAVAYENTWLERIEEDFKDEFGTFFAGNQQVLEDVATIRARDVFRKVKRDAWLSELSDLVSESREVANQRRRNLKLIEAESAVVVNPDTSSEQREKATEVLKQLRTGEADLIRASGDLRNRIGRLAEEVVPEAIKKVTERTEMVDKLAQAPELKKTVDDLLADRENWLMSSSAVQEIKTWLLEDVRWQHELLLTEQANDPNDLQYAIQSLAQFYTLFEQGRAKSIPPGDAVTGRIPRLRHLMGSLAHDNGPFAQLLTAWERIQTKIKGGEAVSPREIENFLRWFQRYEAVRNERLVRSYRDVRFSGIQDMYLKDADEMNRTYSDRFMYKREYVDEVFGAAANGALENFKTYLTEIGQGALAQTISTSFLPFKRALGDEMAVVVRLEDGEWRLLTGEYDSYNSRNAAIPVTDNRDLRFHAGLERALGHDITTKLLQGKGEESDLRDFTDAFNTSIRSAEPEEWQPTAKPSPEIEEQEMNRMKLWMLRDPDVSPRPVGDNPFTWHNAVQGGELFAQGTEGFYRVEPSTGKVQPFPLKLDPASLEPVLIQLSSTWTIGEKFSLKKALSGQIEDQEIVLNVQKEQRDADGFYGRGAFVSEVVAFERNRARSEVRGGQRMAGVFGNAAGLFLEYFGFGLAQAMFSGSVLSAVGLVAFLVITDLVEAPSRVPFFTRMLARDRGGILFVAVKYAAAALTLGLTSPLIFLTVDVVKTLLRIDFIGNMHDYINFKDGEINGEALRQAMIRARPEMRPVARSEVRDQTEFDNVGKNWWRAWPAIVALQAVQGLADAAVIRLPMLEALRTGAEGARSTPAQAVRLLRLSSIPISIGLFSLAVIGFLIIFNHPGNPLKPTFRAPEQLQDTGPYKYFRHPMNTALLSFTLSLTSLMFVLGVHQWVLTFNILASLMIMGLTYFMILNEEKELTSNLPGYAEYRQKTLGVFVLPSAVEDRINIMLGRPAVLETPSGRSEVRELQWENAAVILNQELTREAPPAEWPVTENETNYRNNQVEVRKEVLNILADIVQGRLTEPSDFINRFRELNRVALTGQNSQSIYVTPTMQLDNLSPEEQAMAVRERAGQYFVEAQEAESSILAVFRSLDEFMKAGTSENAVNERIWILGEMYANLIGNPEIFENANHSIYMNIINALLRLMDLNGISHGYWDEIIKKRPVNVAEHLRNMILAANPTLIDARRQILTNSLASHQQEALRLADRIPNIFNFFLARDYGFNEQARDEVQAFIQNGEFLDARDRIESLQQATHKRGIVGEDAQRAQKVFEPLRDELDLMQEIQDRLTRSEARGGTIELEPGKSYAIRIGQGGAIETAENIPEAKWSVDAEAVPVGQPFVQNALENNKPVRLDLNLCTALFFVTPNLVQGRHSFFENLNQIQNDLATFRNASPKRKENTTAILVGGTDFQTLPADEEARIEKGREDLQEQMQEEFGDRALYLVPGTPDTAVQAMFDPATRTLFLRTFARSEARLIESFVEDQRVTLLTESGGSYTFQWYGLDPGGKKIRIEAFEDGDAAAVGRFDFSLGEAHALAEFSHEYEEAQFDPDIENADFAVWVEPEYSRKNIGSVLLRLGYALAGERGQDVFVFRRVGPGLQRFYQSNLAQPVTDASGRAVWTVNLSDVPAEIPTIGLVSAGFLEPQGEMISEVVSDRQVPAAWDDPESIGEVLQKMIGVASPGLAVAWSDVQWASAPSAEAMEAIYDRVQDRGARLPASFKEEIARWGLPKILEELLKNSSDAYARMGEEGEIYLRIARDGNIFFFDVSDDGVGFARVYDENGDFAPLANEVPGAGYRQSLSNNRIGLDITRMLVEAHGGELKILSPGIDGHTTTVRLAIPRDAITFPARSEMRTMELGGLATVNSADVVAEGMNIIPRVRAEGEAKLSEIRKTMNGRIADVMADLGKQPELAKFVATPAFGVELADKFGEFGDIVPLQTAIMTFALGDIPSAFAEEGMVDVEATLDHEKIITDQKQLEAAIAVLTGTTKGPRINVLMDFPGYDGEYIINALQNMELGRAVVLYDSSKKENLGRAWQQQLGVGKVMGLNYRNKDPKTLALKAVNVIGNETWFSLWNGGLVLRDLGVLSCRSNIQDMADPDLKKLVMTAVRFMALKYSALTKQEQKAIAAQPELLRNYLEKFGVLEFVKFDADGIYFDINNLVQEYVLSREVERAA